MAFLRFILDLARVILVFLAYAVFQFLLVTPFLLTGWAWPAKYRKWWLICWYELICETHEFFYNWLQGSRPW